MNFRNVTTGRTLQPNKQTDQNKLSGQHQNKLKIVTGKSYQRMRITRIKLIHANVMPRYINWSAVDENNRFIFTTADLPAEVLTLAARGESLPPGTTNDSLTNIPSTSELSLITTELKWLH